jgi:guanylate cyclase soluble subunit beta
MLMYSLQELEPDAMENECDDIPILRLKGEMIYESERNLLLYLSSPRICSFSDLGKRGLSVSHIPISDSTRELILHNNVYSNDQDRIFQLELRTDELRRAQSQLLSANKRLDDLLYSILPVSVADRLRCKDFVEPERFDQVTVLMSDIVSYTKIGQECQAIDVIKMLQELYSLFDSAARRNEVYKVETVGDAYIVVGGVPERAANHAVNVANQALDMISATKHVKNPRPGEGCVKIRIGIHTGMVYAGVVGVKMPRYCLFGRTVTMAQKAEAAAPHNGILVTEMTFK